MQRHWADKLAEKVVGERDEKEKYIFNFGISPSGKMHIGNLRGELVIPSRVRNILRSKGKEVEIKGVFYTQDPFKGKEEQLEQFDDPKEAEKYRGWRLKDVPDPEGCHDNWPEHFNSEFVPYLDEFGIDENSITTSEFYRMEETKELIKKFFKNAERVREVVNEYRKRNPYPEGWIPFKPYCSSCRRIDTTEAVEINFEDENVKYRCDSCGDVGWSDLKEGKLTWRLEWVAFWEVLNVDFEPYGKDHATPGGSRDSCIALAEDFGLNYSTGFAYNWVYWKRGDEVMDMTSSGNVGMAPQEYLEVAQSEILAYLYMSTKPMKEIYFSPESIPDYYRRFDRAEAVYFGEEEARSDKRERNIKRNYELAVEEVPDEKPTRVPYRPCTLVAQLTDDEDRAIDLLKEMEQISEDIPDKEKERIILRLKKVRKWIENYGTEEYLIQVQDDISEETKDNLSESQKNMLGSLADELQKRERSAGGLQSRIYEMREEFDLSSRELFQAIYLSTLGKESGPRAGQLIKAVGQDEVAKLLKEL